MRHTTDLIRLGPELHHCSSLAQYKHGYVLTFYHGRECHDDQRVTVCFADKPGNIIRRVDLESKTGNPVVWNYKGRVYLIHSIFSDVTADGEEIDYGNQPVRRWMNCDNFLSEVVLDDDMIKVINTTKIEGAYGLLARCQPLVEDNRVIIPMYREEDPLCETWEFDGINIKKLGEFGQVNNNVKDLMELRGLKYGSLGKGVAIQPSITKRGGLYHAMCRNTCRPNTSNAWTCSSPDCKNWSGLTLSSFPNHNNSIISIQHDKSLFVFSSDGRNNMILFNSDTKQHIPLHHQVLSGRQSFSYPNYMVADNGDLHIVHTNSKIIAWHVFDKAFLDMF